MKKECNKVKIKNYILLHLILFFYSLCGIFSKLASNYTFLSFHFLLLYSIVLIILILYALLWQQILKCFPLTIAFANKAIVIAWGMLWGMLLFKEKITWNMLIGTIFIIIGIYLVVKEDE